MSGVWYGTLGPDMVRCGLIWYVGVWYGRWGLKLYVGVWYGVPAPYLRLPHLRPPTSGPPPQAPHLRPTTSGPPPQAPLLRPPSSGPPPQAPHLRPPTSGPPISGPPIQAPHLRPPMSDLPFQTPHLRVPTLDPLAQTPHLKSQASHIRISPPPNTLHLEPSIYIKTWRMNLTLSQRRFISFNFSHFFFHFWRTQRDTSIMKTIINRLINIEQHNLPNDVLLATCHFFVLYRNMGSTMSGPTLFVQDCNIRPWQTIRFLCETTILGPNNARPRAFHARLQQCQTPHFSCETTTMSDPTLFVRDYNIRSQKRQTPHFSRETTISGPNNVRPHAFYTLWLNDRLPVI